MDNIGALTGVLLGAANEVGACFKTSASKSRPDIKHLLGVTLGCLLVVIGSARKTSRDRMHGSRGSRRQCRCRSRGLQNVGSLVEAQRQTPCERRRWKL